MAVNIYRSLLNELRLSSSNGCLKTDSHIFKYISAQFKKFKTTDQQICRAKEEMQFLGQTYLCYLQSLRKQQEIQKHFHGKGERSIRDTANLVGFKLPQDPK